MNTHFLCKQSGGRGISPALILLVGLALRILSAPLPARAADADAASYLAVDLELALQFRCTPPEPEVGPFTAPAPGRCRREDASFLLQTPLDGPRALVVGWSLNAVDYIGALMSVLSAEAAGGTDASALKLVVLTPPTMLELAQSRLSRFPDYRRLRSAGRLLLRPTKDAQNMWMQDAMEIGWDPRTRANTIADLPHFASDGAAKALSLACSLEEGLFFDVGNPSASVPLDSSANHGGNIEGFPGDILLHGYGTSRDILEGFKKADPRLEILEVDTRWLTVGHVDELYSVIPAPAPSTDSRCGFALAHASPALAIELLHRDPRSAVEPPLSHFWGTPPDPRHTHSCIDRLKTSFDGSPMNGRQALQCGALVRANEEYERIIRTDFARIRDAVARRTGCTEIPEVRFPALFLPSERSSGMLRDFERDHGLTPSAEFRVARALNPNPINGISLGDLLLVPEQPNEAFGDAILEGLAEAAPGLRTRFIATPHLHFLMGEAHCGSQVIRACTSEL